MQELLTNLLNLSGLAWWVEITTQSPQCIYYFGPFSGEKDAEAAHTGYVEDLEKEGAQGITVTIKRCKPSELTIAEDTMLNGNKVSSVLGTSM